MVAAHRHQALHVGGWTLRQLGIHISVKPVAQAFLGAALVGDEADDGSPAPVERDLYCFFEMERTGIEPVTSGLQIRPDVRRGLRTVAEPRLCDE